LKVKVLYFASLKSKLNKNYEEIEIDKDTTVKALKDLLLRKYPDLKELLDNCMIAINESYVDENSLLKDNDTVAIIPPVGGG